ncbi:MAG: DUF433 domain-containing protein [Deltaproteobacteria bacterium]|nr:DUF433 domain-containing protein [Deltaproteobacteria bacterium]
MPTKTWRERIVIDPRIHHGVPCIHGTRVPVSILVGSVADGDSTEDLLAAYPQLTAEDIHAALKFAAQHVAGAEQSKAASDTKDS